MKVAALVGRGRFAVEVDLCLGAGLVVRAGDRVLFAQEEIEIFERSKERTKHPRQAKRRIESS